MKILHVVATPRGPHSRTLPIAQAFIDRVREGVPDLEVDVLDLAAAGLPPIGDDLASAKYPLMMGGSVDPAEVPSWPRVVELVEQFLAADAYVVTSPMWNFGLPYVLKHWIDCLVQPGYLFAYTDGYPVPLVHGRRMVCITSRGADYSPTGPMGSYDFQEPYLRAIFGFVGVTDIDFVHAQPMDHPLLQEATITTALAAARDLASRPPWSAVPAVPVESAAPAVPA